MWWLSYVLFRDGLMVVTLGAEHGLPHAATCTLLATGFPITGAAGRGGPLLDPRRQARPGRRTTTRGRSASRASCSIIASVLYIIPQVYGDGGPGPDEPGSTFRASSSAPRTLRLVGRSSGAASVCSPSRASPSSPGTWRRQCAHRPRRSLAKRRSPRTSHGATTPSRPPEAAPVTAPLPHIRRPGGDIEHMFDVRHSVGYRPWLDKSTPTSGVESVDIRAQFAAAKWHRSRLAVSPPTHPQPRSMPSSREDCPHADSPAQVDELGLLQRFAVRGNGRVEVEAQRGGLVLDAQDGSIRGVQRPATLSAQARR